MPKSKYNHQVHSNLIYQQVSRLQLHANPTVRKVNKWIQAVGSIARVSITCG